MPRRLWSVAAALLVLVTSWAVPRVASAEVLGASVALGAVSGAADAADDEGPDALTLDAATAAILLSCRDDVPVTRAPSPEPLEPCVRAATDGPDAPAPLCGDDATSGVAPGIVRRVADDRLEGSLGCGSPSLEQALRSSQERAPEASAPEPVEPACFPTVAAPRASQPSLLIAPPTYRLLVAEGACRELERPPTAG